MPADIRSLNIEQGGRTFKFTTAKEANAFLARRGAQETKFFDRDFGGLLSIADLQSIGIASQFIPQTVDPQKIGALALGDTTGLKGGRTPKQIEQERASHRGETAAADVAAGIETTPAGEVIRPPTELPQPVVAEDSLEGFFTNPTGSTGAQGETIFDIFRPDGTVVKPEEAAGLGLTREVIEGLPIGEAPSGFQSEFLPAEGTDIATSDVEQNLEGTGVGKDFPFEVPSDLLAGPGITDFDIDELLSQFPEPPKAPDLVDDFEALRSERGIPALEQQLNTISAEMRDVEAQKRLALQELEGGKISTRVISREQAEQSRLFNEELDALNRRKQTLVDELGTKNAAVAQIMNLTQQSFVNANAQYANDFNRKLSMIELVQKQKTLVNAEKDRALANWQVLADTFERSGLTWDRLSFDQQVLVESLAAKAGFPGLSQYIGALEIGTERLTTTLVKDTAGNNFYQTLVRNPDGSLEVITTPTGIRSKVTGGDDTEEDMVKDFRNDLSSTATAAALSSGDLTREQLVRSLQTNYPTIENIGENVYATYPDGWEGF